MHWARGYDRRCRAPTERSRDGMHEEMELVEETGAGGVHLENETGVAKVAPCKNWGCKGRPFDREREERLGEA